MNYRHLYHAGNFADVFKHVLLVALLEPFRRKEKPFCVVDTHAGLGLYDLRSIEAEKTREFEGGIGRCLEGPPPKSAAFVRYLEIVRATNAGAGGRPAYYPGSPEVARALLRPQDRVIALELHPEDASVLRRNFASDARVHVHHGDGYRALKALLPPEERRGLVLIDPPFEVTDELDRMRQGLIEGNRRFGTGSFALWYPIKDRAAIDRFHMDVCATGLREISIVELSIERDAPGTFSGSGLLLVRPPFGAEAAIREVLPELMERLDRGGGFFVHRTLVPE